MKNWILAGSTSFSVTDMILDKSDQNTGQVMNQHLQTHKQQLGNSTIVERCCFDDLKAAFKQPQVPNGQSQNDPTHKIHPQDMRAWMPPPPKQKPSNRKYMALVKGVVN